MTRVAYPAYFDTDILVTTSTGSWVPVTGPACVISFAMVNHEKEEEFKEKLADLYKEYTKLEPVKSAPLAHLHRPSSEETVVD